MFYPRATPAKFTNNVPDWILVNIFMIPCLWSHFLLFTRNRFLKRWEPWVKPCIYIWICRKSSVKSAVKNSCSGKGKNSGIWKKTSKKKQPLAEDVGCEFTKCQGRFLSRRLANLFSNEILSMKFLMIALRFYPIFPK